MSAASMKLLWSSRSPFVRKVMVAAHEVGVADRISTEQVVVSANKPNPDVMAINPLNKIPTLVLQDGTTLYDSRVICEYLDSLHDGPRLLPADQVVRWSVLRRQALGDGLLEVLILRLVERARPEQTQSEKSSGGAPAQDRGHSRSDRDRRDRADEAARRRPYRHRLRARISRFSLCRGQLARRPPEVGGVVRRFRPPSIDAGHRTYRCLLKVESIAPRNVTHDPNPTAANSGRLSPPRRRHCRYGNQRRLSRRNGRVDAQHRSGRGPQDPDRCVSPRAPHLRQRISHLLGRAPGADGNRIGQLPAADRRQGHGEPQGGRSRPFGDRDRAPDAHASRSFGGVDRHGHRPTQLSERRARHA